MSLASSGCVPNNLVQPNFGPFIFSINGSTASSATFGATTITTGPQVWEYDYSGLNLAVGDVDGSGLARGTFPLVNSIQGTTDPASGAIAYSRMTAYFLARGGANALAGSGHYYLQHFAAANGASAVGSEVGENVNSINAHIAFTRGAAKQYRIPWGIDMSPWYGPSITAYDNTWPGYGGPDNGHSMSLYKRTYYAAYAAGANWVQAEAAAINYFNGNSLTALGVVGREFYDFTQANPNLGTPYAPIAILIPRTHGLGLGNVTNGLSWYTLAPTATETALMALMESIWPGSFSSTVIGRDESTYMVNAPELFNVITEDAVTADYQIVLDSTHTTYNISSVLPFGISGDIQYLLNKKDNTHWTLTLINNKGVTKQPTSAAVIDSAKDTVVTITGPFSAVTALRGSAVSLSSTINIPVAAGDVAVYSVSL